MARKGDIKGVEAVRSKTVDTKRAATDGQVRPSCKRQKVQSESRFDTKDHLELGQTVDPRQDQVFRFMDLPGELRNHVYVHAAEYAHRCFPPILSKDKAKARRGHSDKTTSSLSNATSSPPLLPHVGLTQVCSLIRSEFRPNWLSSHKIPLCTIDDYLRVFYPYTNSKASTEAQKRLESQYSSSGSLRIWIRPSELDNFNAMKLLKHAARFPHFTITVHSLPNVPVALLSSIQALVANKSSRWVSAVHGNKISLVRLDYYGATNPSIRFVVKEKYATPWMKAIVGNLDPVPEGYAESLGLSEVAKVLQITFGVDYS